MIRFLYFALIQAGEILAMLYSSTFKATALSFLLGCSPIGAQPVSSQQAPETKSPLPESDLYFDQVTKWQKEDNWPPIIAHGEKALAEMDHYLQPLQALIQKEIVIHADLSSIYFYQGQFEEALKQARKCFGLATINNDLSFELKGLYLMSANYRALAGKAENPKIAAKLYKKAISYCEDAVDLMDKSSASNFFKSKVWFNMGSAQSEYPKGSLRKAKQAFEESIQLLRPTEHPDEIARSYIRLCRIAIKGKDYKEAERLLLKIEPLTRRERTLMQLESLKALYLFEMGRLDLAYQVAKKARERSDRLKARQNREQITKLLLMIDQKMKLNRYYVQENLLLIELDGKIHPAFIQLARLSGLKTDGSLDSLLEATQKHWLKQEQERWQMQDTLSKDDPKYQQMLNAINDLGCIQAKQPRQMSYDYALLLGSGLPDSVKQLQFLSELAAKGVRFQTLYMLSSNRPLDPDTESKARRDQLLPSSIDCQSEIELLQALYNHLPLSPELRKVPVVWVSASLKFDSEGHATRPTPADVIQEWLKSHPRPGSCLAISQQPYIYYHKATLRHLLSQDFTLEAVGGKAEENLPLPVHLDNLARWLFTERQFLKQQLALP
ncbi:MAG: hypothetical protein K0S07_1650 [Chlamydiales bacterium]|jgi:tetratricopeptide (TPR) repeat protein|nr:hypothetical protein [Chlamydiales bacterium]